MSDKLKFAPPPIESHKDALQDQPWVIALIDDEPQVHEVTQLVLRSFQFEQRPIKIINTYSAAEARKLFESRDDIALAIVDVVMETDDAGLELIHYIRKNLNNAYTRLVLRTGQPGQAPESQVIQEYDIHDYKDKTELTDTKLKTLLYSALRSYRDICLIKANKLGLERIIESANNLVVSDNLKIFSSAVLEQLTRIIGLDKNAIYANVSSIYATQHKNPSYRILAVTGELFEHTKLGSNEIPESVAPFFNNAMREKKSIHLDNHYVGFYTTPSGGQNLLFVTLKDKLSPLDHHLLDIFSDSVAVAYENLILREEIQTTQEEIVYLLSEAVEKRSKETGGHVKRVAEICYLLAKEVGFLSEQQCKLIRMASPLHDVGKIAIPDQILNKPGKHDPLEWEVMKSHVTEGEAILNSSERPSLQLASVICNEHHEKWDGTGYPKGISGEKIHIAARITAIADVFDALGSTRCYKDAWPTEKIMEFIKGEKGKHFDPNLVDILLEHIDEITEIRAKYPDES